MREETKGTQGVALGYEQHWAFYRHYQLRLSNSSKLIAFDLHDK